MVERIPITLGRVDAITTGLRRAVTALDDDATTEFFHACEVWARTVSDGRRPLGTLNARHEIFVIEAASPSPWILAAFDTTTRELVVAALLDDRTRPTRQVCGALCAAALGESVVSLTWH